MGETDDMSDPLDLTEQELVNITGYARPSNQLRVLKDLGIPARRRPDNTILVLRMHMLHPVSLSSPTNKPIQKSAKR
jgi:hypothetical protein